MCVNVHCSIVVDVFLTSKNISTYYVVVYIGQDRYVLLHVDSILIIFSSFLSRKYKFCLTRLCPNPTFVEHIASNSSSSINTQIVREIHPLLCNIIISAAFQSHQILLWSSRVFLTTKYTYLPELFLYMHLNKQEIEF